jgi:hypothetical protein
MKMPRARTFLAKAQRAPSKMESEEKAMKRGPFKLFLEGFSFKAFPFRFFLLSPSWRLGEKQVLLFHWRVFSFAAGCPPQSFSGSAI